MFKILVVEDDKDLNRTVRSFLNASGYQAVGCFDANEAYDAMCGSTFDLIVSDIMMPGIDGYEFAKTVRSLNEEIPILFMTARDDFASKQRGYRIGIDDYMVKPIDPGRAFPADRGAAAAGENRHVPQAGGRQAEAGHGRANGGLRWRGYFSHSAGVQHPL